LDDDQLRMAAEVCWIVSGATDRSTAGGAGVGVGARPGAGAGAGATGCAADGDAAAVSSPVQPARTMAPASSATPIAARARFVRPALQRLSS